MPRPRKGERKRDFIKRAIRYLIEEEGLDPHKALGKAHGLWRFFMGKGK